MYDPIMVQPMRDEVIEVGFRELLSAADVDATLSNHKGTALVFINSVCGCAAGGARPALRIALSGATKKPAQLITAFAGMERDAANRARQFFTGYAPSSPMIALLKDGEVVHMVERHQIEGQTPDAIAKSLKWAFEQFC